MVKHKNQRENVFFQQKCFWSKPKTFASFSGVSFVEKHEGNKRRYTKNLIKNFKFLFCFSRPNLTLLKLIKVSKFTLTLFSPMFHFYTLWKGQKTFGYGTLGLWAKWNIGLKWFNRKQSPRVDPFKTCFWKFLKILWKTPVPSVMLQNNNGSIQSQKLIHFSPMFHFYTP